VTTRKEAIVRATAGRATTGSNPPIWRACARRRSWPPRRWRCGRLGTRKSTGSLRSPHLLATKGLGQGIISLHHRIQGHMAEGGAIREIGQWRRASRRITLKNSMDNFGQFPLLLRKIGLRTRGAMAATWCGFGVTW
jgi:hypothetical protein